jgi:predicted transposase YbfD/YdcC
MIDLMALEAHLADLTEPLSTETAPSATLTTPAGQVLQGQALDGKEVRGSQAHGQPLTLVSLVQHGTGITLTQVETDTKSNEIPAAAQLLADRDLTNTVTTADALHTQRELAQQILDQHGHYLMVVKENQPTLYQAIQLLFEQPPWLTQEQTKEYQVYASSNKGHGRREKRCLECSTALNTYLAVCRRETPNGFSSTQYCQISLTTWVSAGFLSPCRRAKTAPTFSRPSTRASA